MDLFRDREAAFESSRPDQIMRGRRRNAGGLWRRRVGKTTLINKLIDDSTVKVISFVALERGEKEQLETMSDLVLSSLAPDLLGSVKFESFEKVFDFVGRSATTQRVVFLIDEYPYLAKECKYMNSLLQRFVDHEWADTQLFLIQCGSPLTKFIMSPLTKAGKVTTLGKAARVFLTHL